MVYKVYQEKISASEIPYTEREEFSKLISDAKSGLFKTVIVFKRDRLARRTEDFLKIKNIFKQNGIKVIYSNEGEFQPDDSPMSDFIDNIISAIAELEVHMSRDRANSGRLRKRERKIYSTSRIPFGFQKVTTSSVTSFEPKECNISDTCSLSFKDFICYIFDYANNYYHTTGLYVCIGLRNSYKGLPENISSGLIDRILRNPVYAGLHFVESNIKLKDTFILNSDGTFNSIDKSYFHKLSNVKGSIDAELWFSCIEKLFKNYKLPRKNKIKNDYLFKDLIHCGHCNDKVSLAKFNLKCKNDSCFDLPKLELINMILKYIIYENFYQSKDSKTSPLNLKVNDLQKNINEANKTLKALLISQNQLVLSYTSNLNNEIIKDELVKNQVEQDKLCTKISRLKINISYLNKLQELSNNSLNIDYLIEIMHSNKELTKQYIYNNIKKVNINVSKYTNKPITPNIEYIKE